MISPSPKPISLEEQLAQKPYDAYVYGYPHKTAYRPLTPPVPIRQAWANERREALFLYMHVPFCEMRCGFCNLFTTPRPHEELVADFMASLSRQCAVVKRELGGASFARFAIGGGTPTLLDVPSLERIFDLAERELGAPLGEIAASVETSPETATEEKLRVLRDRGTTRVSIGVQSFIEREAASVKRPQRTHEVAAALDLLRKLGFPTVNIDLMYGLPDQTSQSWEQSLEMSLRWQPEEIYLYPLYVRPLTTLSRSSRSPSSNDSNDLNDSRLALYRQASERLGAAGYTQSSMRMFRAAHAPTDDGPVYCVQEDGMVGLGCGARSYTSNLHYASEYAVGAKGVREVLDAWIKRTDQEFAIADYGFALNPEEQQRRFVELSLLADGLELAAYERRFGTHVMSDLPALAELEPTGLAKTEEGKLKLSARGLELSDALGPWLYSDEVRALIQDYELR